jgi:hypothetical protein
MATERQPYCQRYLEHEDVEVLVYHQPHVEQWVGTSHQGTWIHADHVGPSVTVASTKVVCDPGPVRASA